MSREPEDRVQLKKIGNPKDSVGHGQGKPSRALGHSQRSDSEIPYVRL